MRWLGWLKDLVSSRDHAPSTSAATRVPIARAATDLNARLNAAIRKRDDAYERKDFRDYGHALMELKAVQIARLEAERASHVQA